MSQVAEPHALRWTTTAYHAAAAAGVFETVQVELIAGEIIEMSPMTARHAMVIYIVQKVLERVFADGYIVITQSPLDLSADSEPQPDVAVYAGPAHAYLEQKPTDALLVVEVAETSVRFDRGPKASLYAKAGIADYWIINLKDQTVEVYRTPAALDTHPLGFGYKVTMQLTRQDTISPLAAPDAVIPVAEVLPQ